MNYKSLVQKICEETGDNSIRSAVNQVYNSRSYAYLIKQIGFKDAEEFNQYFRQRGLLGIRR